MPFRLTSQKYVDLLDHVDDRRALENFLRMEKWIFDSPDQPGEMFREFVTWFVKENRLVEGTTTIGGRAVDLKNVAMPRAQHLRAPGSPRAAVGEQTAGELVGSSDYSEHEFQGGHIGIYVSGSAQREIPERIAGWLRERDQAK